MDTKFFIFLLVGYLFVWLGMKFPPLSESKIVIVKRIWTCSLCSGVWVYTFLSYVMGEHLFGDLFYLPFISELATGGIISFLVFLIEIGFRERFQVIEIG